MGTRLRGQSISNPKRPTIFIAEGGEEQTFCLVPKRQGAAINGWPAVCTAPCFACRPLRSTVRAVLCVPKPGRPEP